MTDTLYAHDSQAAQRETAQHYAELADAAREKELRDQQTELADIRTRPIRQAIKGLAPFLTEHEACALISCLHSAINESPMKHRTEAQSAIEGLMDAHKALENML